MSERPAATLPPLSGRLRKGDLSGSPIRKIMELADPKNIVDMGLDPDEVISFAGGWVAHHAPEALRAEYQRIADDPHLFHELGAYSPTRGLPSLRKAILATDAELYATPGLSDDHIIIGQSSTQLTYSLFVALLDAGDRVVLFDPAYANYPPQLALCQDDIEVCRLRVLDPESWGFWQNPYQIMGELESLLVAKRPRLLLFSSPDNPTGRLIPDDVFVRILEMAGRFDCFVAVDFAYRAQHFLDAEPEQYSVSPVDYPNLIRIHSNSKWCRGLGRRLGWVEAVPEVVRALEIVQQGTALCGDTVHQYALAQYLAASIGDGSFRSYLTECRVAYRSAAERMSMCVEEYLDMPFLPPEGGLYTVVDVGRDGDAFVVDVLRATGVIFVPGSGFGPSLQRAIRVSYGPLVHELDRLEDGFARVGAYLKKQKGA